MPLFSCRRMILILDNDYVQSQKIRLRKINNNKPIKVKAPSNPRIQTQRQTYSITELPPGVRLMLVSDIVTQRQRI